MSTRGVTACDMTCVFVSPAAGCFYRGILLPYCNSLQPQFRYSCGGTPSNIRLPSSHRPGSIPILLMSRNEGFGGALAPTIQTSRVNQLDAELLDDELEHILTEPLFTALAPILGTDWRPELTTLFKFIILRSSLNQSFSYGAQLENLRWVDGKTGKKLTQNQLFAYSLLAVLPRYFRIRVRDYMLASGWADYPPSPNWKSLFIFNPENPTRRLKYLKRTLWNTSERLEEIYSGLDLINFLLFLFNGKYRSVLERFLGISFIYHRLDLQRSVSFEFLNRQLVWESMTELVLFILPFINFKRIRLRLKDGKSRLINWLRLVMNSNSSPNQQDTPIAREKVTSQQNQARFPKLSNEICPICVADRVYPSKSSGLGFNSNVFDPHDPMTFSSSSISTTNEKIHDHVKIPYQVNCCNGLYCYYCLVTQIIYCRENYLDQTWICWRCANKVTSIKRWNGGCPVT